MRAGRSKQVARAASFDGIELDRPRALHTLPHTKLEEAAAEGPEAQS